MAAFRIDLVGTDAELELASAIACATTPEEEITTERLRHHRRIDPDGAIHLARDGDAVVGAATSGRIFSYQPDYDGLWVTLHVLPDERRRGIGTALLATVSADAAARGKTTLHVPVLDSRTEAREWLERRGFAEWGRTRTVALPLAGLPAPAVDPPPGVVIVSLAERPELARGLHAVAAEAYPDIPSGDEPEAVEEYEAWRLRDLDGPGLPHEACFAALAGDEVVGFANLELYAVRAGVAAHAMTAVRRAWRGRGVASALKRATIAWAIAAGLEELETDNDLPNAPMRAINARLGYQPRADRLILRGPLVP